MSFLAEEYSGDATVRVGGAEFAVRVHLDGRFEPIDGRYHWGGRIAPDERLTAEVRAGRRTATLQVPGGQPVPARLGEPDPWSGVRITGAGRPPHWPAVDAG